jgi:formiminoglutamate deiminase
VSSVSTPARTSLFFREALLPEGWARDVRVGVEGGRIANISAGAVPGPGEADRRIAIPAIANLHSHTFQRGMAGLAEVRGPSADSFWTWREVMYRFLGRMTPEDVESISAFAFMEMVERGFGRVGEFHYLHHDPLGRPYAAIGEMAERIVAAAERAGIALTLLPVFYAHGGFGGAPPAEGQRRFINDRDGFARLLAASERAIAGHTGAKRGVAPHSLRAVTPDELAHLVAIADGRPIHMHIAEQVREVDDCAAWSGQRPVEWLLDHADVDDRWCLIHATHMTAAETGHLARTGATAGLCPLTEASLGDGIFNGPEWIAAGGAYGIGTDSNILVGVSGELRQLEYAQRLRQRLRNVMAAGEGDSVGRALFDTARDGGAGALGVEAPAIAIGRPADIVGLDGDHPSIAERHGDAILDGWIFAGGDPVIESVWRNGTQLVASGLHLRRDEIASAYRSSLARLVKT